MSLAAELDERAAEHVGVGDLSLPAHYGDAQREYDAARGAVALTHRAERGLFRVTGADRVKFLQGMLSNDVGGLAAGSGARALFLDNKGHVRGVLDLWAEPNALVVGCDTRFIDEALPDLTRYILGSDVRVEDLRPAQTVLALLGSRSDAALAAIGIEPPAAGVGAHRGGDIGGTAVRMARTPDLGVAGLEVHVAADAAPDVWQALESIEGDAPVLVGWLACEALRIEGAVPRIGHEITGSEFPQELRLDDTIDYEKGCYLGQETVARIHYRGQVNRLLCVLHSSGPLPGGAELISSGKEVGRITSTAASPRHGTVGLALVRREEADGNATVAVRQDGELVAEAQVVTPAS